jgi:valyl-tRNA synthetase
MEFGTGAVKITPAHDANDFEVGKRHKLECINILNEDATLNDQCGNYVGFDRFVARSKIITELQKNDLLIKTDIYEKEIGYSERSKVEIEPCLSLQWFVKMDELAKRAIHFQNTNDKINFVPKEMEERYIRWMSGVHDWCISRQLWWGHRIPVWYCDDCCYEESSESDLIICPSCQSKNIRQDEDVLDTWFSSGLWAFSTLDWMDNSPLFKRYYPTDALVTAYDILPLWVSRMIFLSLEFTGEKPFKDVLIHGLVLDENGEKQSKSKGNGIDPIEIIEEHGADALRFALLTGISLGSDLKFNKEKITSARAFGIKLWNASRYILMNLEENFMYQGIGNPLELSIEDKWILSRFNETVQTVNDSFEKYDFAKAGQSIRSFFFDDYCDWYIEFTKNHTGEKKNNSLNVLLYVLDGTLKLLHPLMPFLTEEISSNLPFSNKLIMISEYPKTIDTWMFEEEEKIIEECKEIITKVRTLRLESKSSIPLPMVIQTKNHDLKQFERVIRQMAKVNFLIFQEEKDFYGKAITLYSKNSEINLPFSGIYDLKEEKERLTKELAKWEKEIERSNTLLTKETFLEKAKPEIIEKEREKLKNYLEQYEKTKQLLKDINHE